MGYNPSFKTGGIGKDNMSERLHPQTAPYSAYFQLFDGLGLGLALGRVTLTLIIIVSYCTELLSRHSQQTTSVGHKILLSLRTFKSVVSRCAGHCCYSGVIKYGLR